MTERKRYANPEVQEKKKTAKAERYATQPEVRQRHADSERKRYAENPEVQDKKKSTYSERYATQPEVRQRHKDLERKRYAENPQVQEKKKSTKAERYATQPEVRQRHKDSERKRYAENPQVQEKKKSTKAERYATQPEVRQRHKDSERNRYAENPQVQEKKKSAAAQRYASQPEVREKHKDCKRQRYAQSKADTTYDKLLADARKTVSQLPVLACTVCHRMRYREQVVQCKRENYTGENPLIQQCLTGDFIHVCKKNCEFENSEYHKMLKLEWICHTCHSALKRNKMPVQAVINGHDVGEIPEQLKVLNPLERHLIALVQAFIKIIPLPKGGQMGIRGQLVCVPADVQRTADSLPWTPDVDHLIRVKLKRKIKFKGHHLYMNVSQRKIMDALFKLKEINPLYKDVKLNERWIADVIERGYQDIVSELNTQQLEEQDVQCNSTTESFQSDDQFINGFERLAIQNTMESHSLCSESEQALPPTISGRDISMSNEQDESNEEEMHSKFQRMETNQRSETQNAYDDVEHPFGMVTLQPVDPTASYSDKDVLSLAPSEGQKPIKQMENEATCFPCKFPFGKSTYLVQDEDRNFVQDRIQNISIAKYCDSRVFCAKNLYDDDGEYLAYLQSVKGRDQINSAASIALRKGKSTNVDGSKVTVGSILKGSKQKGNVLKNSQGYRYLRAIPGTPPYWEVGMGDLFSGFKQIGPPNVFISFSAADRRWPEIAKAALLRNGQNPDLYSTLTWEEYCKLINQNPVAAVTMFERRVKAQVRLIKSAVQPLGGEVLDGFLRREMQDRGWPHIHGVFWIKGAPSMQKSEEAHVKFVEKIVSCSIPDEESDPELHDIVMSVQKHSKRHAKSCFKNQTKGDPDCRYGYPLPISDESFILHPGSPPDGQNERQWRKEAKQKIKEIQNFLTNTDDLENCSVDEVLSHHSITKDLYREYLSAICRRDQVILKRQPHEAFINFYNEKLLRFWDGYTVHIQSLCSGEICHVLHKQG